MGKGNQRRRCEARLDNHGPQSLTRHARVSQCVRRTVGVAPRPRFLGYELTAIGDRDRSWRSSDPNRAATACTARAAPAIKYLLPQQIGCQCRQLIKLAFCPAVLDSHICGFRQSQTRLDPAERLDHVNESVTGLDMEEPNHRRSRLLRPRRQRPDGRRAAEQRDECAACQPVRLHAVPCQHGKDRRITI